MGKARKAASICMRNDKGSTPADAASSSMKLSQQKAA